MPKPKKEQSKHIFFFYGVEDSIKAFIPAKNLSNFFFKRRFNIFFSHFQSFKLNYLNRIILGFDLNNKVEINFKTIK